MFDRAGLTGQMIETEDHELRVSWKIRGHTFAIFNNFLKADELFSQPVLSQIYSDSGAPQYHSFAKSYTVNKFGKVSVLTSKQKLIDEIGPSGSIVTSLVSEDGTHVALSTRHNQPDENPEIQSYLLEANVERLIMPGIKVTAYTSDCSEAQIPNSVLAQPQPHFFELIVATQNSEMESLGKTSDDWDACAAASANCTEIENEFNKKLQTAVNTWEQTNFSSEIAALKIPQERSRLGAARAKRIADETRRRNETRRSSYREHSGGAISAETERRLDCVLQRTMLEAKGYGAIFGNNFGACRH